jgi:hypothetical protein
VRIGNRSNQPAFHTIVQIGIHESIGIVRTGAFEPIGRSQDGSIRQNWPLRRLSSPPELPIFKEFNADVAKEDLQLSFGYRLLSGDSHRLKVTVVVYTPGYTNSEDWFLLLEGHHLRLLKPGHGD